MFALQTVWDNIGSQRKQLGMGKAHLQNSSEFAFLLSGLCIDTVAADGNDLLTAV